MPTFIPFPGLTSELVLPSAWEHLYLLLRRFSQGNGVWRFPNIQTSDAKKSSFYSYTLLLNRLTNTFLIYAVYIIKTMSCTIRLQHHRQPLYLMKVHLSSNRHWLWYRKQQNFYTDTIENWSVWVISGSLPLCHCFDCDSIREINSWFYHELNHLAVCEPRNK